MCHTPKDYVVLVHGIAKSGKVMRNIENYLRPYYEAVNLDYPSCRYPIETLARDYLATAVERRCPDKAGKIHFVAHSMGGLVVRQFLKSQRPENLGRVVMLCPPLMGSELADFFKDNFLYRRLYGPAGQELGTDPSALPQRLGPVDFELGVIMGDRSIDPICCRILPGPNDGRVTVARSRITGMKDHIVLPSSHTFILRTTRALRQIFYFLANGRFYRE